MAAKVSLRKFSRFTKSRSFVANYHAAKDDGMCRNEEDMALILLKVCLDELFGSWEEEGGDH